MTEICKLTVDKSGKAKFESAQTVGLDLKRIIAEDAIYGKMTPKNGKYFTVRVMNEDQELTKKQIQKIIKFTHHRIEKRIDVDFRTAKPGEYADFSILFRTVETDERNELLASTVMYHFYPINDFDNPNRGVCVVNKAFFFTGHGNAVTGQFMIEHGVRVQFPNGTYVTLDFDAIYTHELGHGLGLPHSKLPGHVMSYRVDIMAEFLTEVEDVPRLQAKYPKKIITKRKLFRWLKWLVHASDRLN